MADFDKQVILDGTNRVTQRWKEIVSGVYGLFSAVAIYFGDTEVSAANPLPVTGGGGAALPVSVADGDDVAEGATTDAAVVTDTTGTVSGKLRGLVKWAFERMPTSLGQKTKAASLPVTLASDEDVLTTAIDQTTPGTTNKVVASVASGGIASGAIASGAVASGAVAAGAFAAGSIAAGAKVAAAEIDGHSQTLGITTGAAVVTDASGTVQQYLRGLVKLLVDIVTVKIDQTTPGTTNRVDAGDEITISQTPTVTAGAYAANDAVGGLLTFADAARAAGMGGVIKNLLIVDDNGQDAIMELWLFRETFVAMADNAPWAPSEADLRKLVGIVSTADGAWYDAGTPSVGQVEASKEYTCVGTSLFGQLVTRGTPTPLNTDDVTVILGLLRH